MEFWPLMESYVDLGTISFRRFLEVLADPPARNIGFEIAPEDQEKYREFLAESAARRKHA